MKKHFLVLLLMLMGIGVQAQIPAEVKDILKKCGEKNHHEGGAELDIKMDVGMVLFSLKGTMKVWSKGDKSFSTVRLSFRDHEMYSEKGFDGTQEWKYTKASDEGERDTLVITRKTQKSKGKYDVELNMDKDYKKAKLKTTAKFYEITFTDPLKKDSPRKTIVRIVKDTYMLHQIETKVSVATAKMTLTKVKFGVSDNVFELDLKKYPNAVIVRK